MALNAPANPPRPTLDRSMVAMDKAVDGKGGRNMGSESFRYAKGL